MRSGDRLLGNQKLTERRQLPKSAVSRLTNTLAHLGDLIWVPASSKHRLGIATLALDSAMPSRPRLLELSQHREATLPRRTRSAVGDREVLDVRH